ncbi:hypothetical protein L7F22_062304 [Adiantum nelumboides]|nr:hypothetical protein [Adiantum nelumboides]
MSEGLQITSDHPASACGIMAGSGLLLMKRPRRFLLRNTIGRFQSEESLLTRSENRVRELRQSIDLLKKESKKLEERAKLAGDELLRGRTKLKHVGSQIQKLANSIHKTESQSQGLMESLRELPGRDALRFRAEVETSSKLPNMVHSSSSSSSLRIEEAAPSDLTAEVASMTAEAKQQRNSLTKEVSKIANFGISV